MVRFVREVGMQPWILIIILLVIPEAAHALNAIPCGCTKENVTSTKPKSAESPVVWNSGRVALWVDGKITKHWNTIKFASPDEAVAQHRKDVENCEANAEFACKKPK
jgi:hypothetical protein